MPVDLIQSSWPSFPNLLLVYNNQNRAAPISRRTRDVQVRVRGMPEPGVAGLNTFADYCCNGLQKDPSRQEPNWVIVHKNSAASVSADRNSKRGT